MAYIKMSSFTTKQELTGDEQIIGLSNGGNVKFPSLALKEFIGMQAASYIPISGTALPTLDTNQYFSIVTEGIYTRTGQPNVVVPEGKMAVLVWDGSMWSIASTMDLPTTPVDGVVEEGNTQAVSGGEVYNKLIKGWVIAEAMAISNPTYSADGNISGAVITWSDGDVGSISNVVVSSNGITSIRYNRSNGDYATMSVVYDSKGDFQSQEVIITKA